LVFRLPAQAEAARLARHSIRRTLIGKPDQVVARVELLVSELVTNSVIHAALSPDQGVDLKIAHPPSRIRVEVADQGKPFKPRMRTRPDGASRWGLFLLDQMADRWGIDRLERGKTVWFEVDL
jgi:anti-sigma regulatory factor (Ser/Thr protein kinase)